MEEPFDQLEPPPASPKPKMLLGKVVLINFGIMLAYMAFIGLVINREGPDAGLGVGIGYAVLLALQVGLNLFAGMVWLFSKKLRHVGKAMLIGGLITAAIGFGTCLTVASLFD